MLASFKWSSVLARNLLHVIKEGNGRKDRKDCAISRMGHIKFQISFIELDRISREIDEVNLTLHYIEKKIRFMGQVKKRADKK